jgi:hypothetical protein
MWVYRVCSRGFRGAGGAGTACSVSSVCRGPDYRAEWVERAGVVGIGG